MKKNVYETPEMELIEIASEQAIFSGSLDSVRPEEGDGWLNE